jgi:type I restriction enzyme S subunit
LDVLEDVSGGNAKTPQGEFLSEGDIPVVDQGQGLIAGYVTDKTRLCKAKLPVIVFGDHTRIIKYVDFPFAMGADGTKVLAPRNGDYPKYLYHALQAIRIPSAGYSRHYKFLKETEIPLPPLVEQKRIAGILDAADALRAKRREALAQLDTLLQATFLDLFGDPVTNPKGWEQKQLSEVVLAGTIVTYGIVQAGDEYPGGVPYIRTGDIVDGAIDMSDLRRTDPALAAKFARSTVRTGEIVMSIRATVGTAAVVPAELDGANLTQGTARIAPGESTLLAYLYHFIRSQGCQSWIQRQIKGATFREITLKRLREMPILVPPLSIQRMFGEVVEAIDMLKKQCRNHLAELNTLFASLQSRAFRGDLNAR